MNLFEQGLSRYLTPEQLNKIQSKRIGIGGAGGLGSNVAVILVRCGFRHFEIIDSDIIEPSNLNRQQYFIDEIGQKKVETLKKRLLGINPDLTVKSHYAQWTPKTGSLYFKGCNFIVEAFDSVDGKFKFVEFYQELFPFVISGNGMAGLLDKKPMEIKSIGNVFIVGDRSTCAGPGNPPMAPRVTACASMMAEIILELTLKDDQ